jgi:hypothetical protein
MRAILWRSLQVTVGATSTRVPRRSAGYAIPDGTRAMRHESKFLIPGDHA